MFKRAEAKFVGATEKVAPNGRKIYKAIATTPALDRYGEVVLPKGCDDKHFRNNPVLLEIHDYSKTAVGHLHSWEINEDAIPVEFTFSDDDRGRELEKKYVDGDMNAFSIGFRAKSDGIVDLWYPWDEKPPDLKSIEVRMPDGSTCTLDFSKYEQIPFRVYKSWEWLELSPVPVPANPEALLLREANDMITRAYGGDAVRRGFMEEEVRNRLNPILHALRGFTDTIDFNFQIDKFIHPHSCPVVDEPWNPSDAKTALVRWASADGKGTKETINWAQYSKGFGLFDPNKADAFTSYKFLHHTVVPEKGLVAVWRGITAGMAAVLSGGGGTEVDETDRKAVYDHFALHYKDHGQEPPEYRSDYTAEELKSIGEGDWGVRAETASQTELMEEPEAEVVPAATEQRSLDSLSAQIAELGAKLAGIAEGLDEHFINVNLKLAQLDAGITELGSVKRSEEPKQTVSEPQAPAQDGQVAPVVTVSASLVEKLNRFTM